MFTLGYALNCPILNTERKVPEETLFGRAAEQAALASLLSRCSESAAALVAGEAGIGKTALLRQTASYAKRSGFTVLKGQCYDAYEAGPFLPFFEVVKQLGARGDLQLGETLVPRAALGEAGSSWLDKDTRLARDSFVRDLSDVILSVAERSPVLLIIDDVQWADTGTLLVLNCLLDIGAPNLVLLLAERNDEATPPDRINLQLAVRAKVQRLELEGLDLAAAREMVVASLGTGELSDAELRAVVASTHGNPLFIRELLEHFHRSGGPGVETLADFLKKERLPNSLSAMIDLRLSRLPAHVLAAVRAASIFNGPFVIRSVADLLQEQADSVEDAFNVALHERMLRRFSGVETSRYEFVHELYCKRLYERLLASERRELHARAVEGTKRGTLILDENELARHSALGSSETTAREAVADCARAAEKAEGLLTFETAARFWQLAITCSADVDEEERAELRRRLGWSCWASGRWEQAVAAWCEAAKLFEAGGNEQRLAEVALALADVHRWRAELDDAKHWASLAARLPLTSVADRGLAAALMGDILALQSEQAEARQYLDEALGYWQEGGRHPSAAWWLGHGLLLVGDLAASLQIGEEGIEEARRQGATGTAALIASGLLASDLGMLGIDAARQRLKIVEDGTNAYDSGGRISLLNRQACVLGYSAQWRKVLELTNEWTADFRLAGAYQVATARMTAAAAHLALGEAVDAEQLIGKALPNTEGMRPSASLYLAEALIRQGRVAEARSIVDSVAPANLTEPRLAGSLALMGHVAAAFDDELMTASCYEALAKERRAILIVYSCTSVQRVLGRLAAASRDWPTAIRHFEDAVQHLHRGQAWSELAWALADYAVMRRARNRRGDLVKAAALEARASQLFAELGMWNPQLGETLSDARKDPFGLSSRELEVLQLVAQGMRNREIGAQLTISERTVQRHLENVFEKMGVDRRTEAVVKAVELGVLFADQLKVPSSISADRLNAN